MQCSLIFRRATISVLFGLSLSVGTLLAQVSVAGILGLPGLQAVQMIEYTNGPLTFTWAQSDPALVQTQFLLTDIDNDAHTNAPENFDIYVCDIVGNLDPQGDFLRVDCAYPGPYSGANIDAIGLVMGSSTIWANSIVFVAPGSGGTAGGFTSALGAPDGAYCSLGFTSPGDGSLISIVFDFNLAVSSTRSSFGEVKALFER